MSIEEMKRRKAELGYTNEQIAQLSGVPLSTVQKIFAGITAQPRYDTLMALERVLGQRTDRVCEAELQYRAGAETCSGEMTQSGYTLEKFYEITEGRRAELIDGEIYYLSSPSTKHQMILGALWRALDEYIANRNGTCIPFMAPCDIKLKKEKNEIFQPDIFVVCDLNQIQEKYILGAPDLIVEILSLTTRTRDMSLKLNKYVQAGVREYWIVDPENERVVVYLQEEQLSMRIYGFHDRIPVSIFDGHCLIDFEKIFTKVNEVYSQQTFPEF